MPDLIPFPTPEPAPGRDPARPPDRPRFDWLDVSNPRGRRSTLLLIKKAINEDWPMPPEARAELIEALTDLAGEPGLPTSQRITIYSILAVNMRKANLRATAGRPCPTDATRATLPIPDRGR